MKRTRFYNKLAKWLALASLPVASLLAQSPGTQENPILDTLLIQQQGMYLKFRYAKSSHDSTIWSSERRTVVARNQSVIFVDSDTMFLLKAKRDALWYYDTQLFTGIRLIGDTVYAPTQAGATYSWSKDGDSIRSSLDRIAFQGYGFYYVTVTVPGNPNLGGQYYTSLGTPPQQGDTRDLAILDSSILVSNYNLFSINSKLHPDTIEWVRTAFSPLHAPELLLKEMQTGKVYILRDHKWYWAPFQYDGIMQSYRTLSIQTFAPATYTWYKNGNLIVDSTKSTLGNIETALYAVTVVWGPEAGVYAGQSATFTTQAYYTEPGTKNYPIPVTDMIVKSGLTLSISNSYHPDSIFWVYSDLNYRDSIPVQSPTYTITGDAIIQALILVNGKWYNQFFTFQGIQYNDSIGQNKELKAPVIAGATYTWYLNDQLLPSEKLATLVPKDTGLYRVEISWLASNNALTNTRTEESLQTAVFSFRVKSLPITTDLANDNRTVEGFEVYPNPAQNYLFIKTSSTGASIEYVIKNNVASTVLAGTISNGGQVDISSLSSGLYYVQLWQADKLLTKKLVVK